MVTNTIIFKAEIIIEIHFSSLVIHSWTNSGTNAISGMSQNQHLQVMFLRRKKSDCQICTVTSTDEQ